MGVCFPPIVDHLFSWPGCVEGMARAANTWRSLTIYFFFYNFFSDFRMYVYRDGVCWRKVLDSILTISSNGESTTAERYGRAKDGFLIKTKKFMSKDVPTQSILFLSGFKSTPPSKGLK